MAVKATRAGDKTALGCVVDVSREVSSAKQLLQQEEKRPARQDLDDAVQSHQEYREAVLKYADVFTSSSEVSTMKFAYNMEREAKIAEDIASDAKLVAEATDPDDTPHARRFRHGRRIIYKCYA